MAFMTVAILAFVAAWTVIHLCFTQAVLVVVDEDPLREVQDHGISPKGISHGVSCTHRRHHCANIMLSHASCQS